MSEMVAGGLPVIQRPIDNTALSTYLACPREYLYSMIQHRRRGGKSAALTFGSAWHKALETHYKSGGDAELVETAVRLSWEGHDSPEDYRTLERVLVDYRKLAKDREYQDFKDTVGYPHAPLVELATNSIGGGLIHPWAGKIDRIVNIGGLYYVEDHKTTSRFDKNYWTQFKLSYQMKGYTFLGQQLMPSANVVGVRINLSHVLTNKTTSYRQLFTFSKDDIKEWVRVTNSWVGRLGRDIEMYEKLLAEGFDSIEAMDICFPMHFGDNGCSRKFGMCQYHSVCSVNPRIRHRVLENEFEVLPWNPLEDDDD